MIVNKKKLPVWVLLAVGLGILAVMGYKRFGAPHSVMQAQSVYPMAPGFRLTDPSGGSVALSEYQGKVVLLDFWATWCGRAGWRFRSSSLFRRNTGNGV
jgi:cytochrome oxidase Cu insertion factor (SCO1/SenC/PrrC family)